MDDDGLIPQHGLMLCHIWLKKKQKIDDLENKKPYNSLLFFSLWSNNKLYFNTLTLDPPWVSEILCLLLYV